MVVDESHCQPDYDVLQCQGSSQKQSPAAHAAHAFLALACTVLSLVLLNPASTVQYNTVLYLVYEVPKAGHPVGNRGHEEQELDHAQVLRYNTNARQYIPCQ
jgi:hypothetical protein